jgi:demethoxyubiquinone hydroxylase (CLK1/Coq7/Cat5 family)
MNNNKTNVMKVLRDNWILPFGLATTLLCYAGYKKYEPVYKMKNAEVGKLNTDLRVANIQKSISDKIYKGELAFAEIKDLRAQLDNIQDIRVRQEAKVTMLLDYYEQSVRPSIISKHLKIEEENMNYNS